MPLSIPLAPVDSLTVTTLIDNVFDVLMPDQGPAHRLTSAAETTTLPTATMVGGLVPNQVIAEHGLSLLLTITRNGQSHQLLFDTGVSPDGMVANMRPAADRAPRQSRRSSAATATSTTPPAWTGSAGAVGGSANLPVMIHPEFWAAAASRLPGREPRELPTTSRRALEGAGFEIIEERRARLPVRRHACWSPAR